MSKITDVFVRKLTTCNPWLIQLVDARQAYMICDGVCVLVKA
jgi:hypothetical protein